VALIKPELLELEKSAYSRGFSEAVDLAAAETERDLRRDVAEARRRGFEKGLQAARGRLFNRAIKEAEERGIKQGLAKIGCAPLPERSVSVDDFIRQRLVITEGGRCSFGQIYEAFRLWWPDPPELLPSETALGRMLGLRFRKLRSNGRSFYTGVCLKYEGNSHPGESS